jgi:uncharacterized protein (DUF433 family)
MDNIRFNRIGRGVYSLTEAARLSDVPQRRIRRWTMGYSYKFKGESHYSPPIIASEVAPVNGAATLDFGDLLEVRFLNAFREHKVSWKAIRIASERAKELLGRHHPFSTRIFKTDGRTILAEIVKETGDKVLLDLVKNQYEFERIVSPFLYAGIEFDKLKEPMRWWPLGENRLVVVDPTRSFGAPIVDKGGVPTKILFDAFRAEKSTKIVANLYEVNQKEVKDAVYFERRLAA